MHTEEFVVFHTSWPLIIAQIINLAIVVLLVISPFIIWRWLSKKENERKEQLNRIEAKLNQIESNNNLAPTNTLPDKTLCSGSADRMRSS